MEDVVGWKVRMSRLVTRNRAWFLFRKTKKKNSHWSDWHGRASSPSAQNKSRQGVFRLTRLRQNVAQFVELVRSLNELKAHADVGDEWRRRKQLPIARYTYNINVYRNTTISDSPRRAQPSIFSTWTCTRTRSPLFSSSSTYFFLLSRTLVRKWSEGKDPTPWWMYMILKTPFLLALCIVYHCRYLYIHIYNHISDSWRIERKSETPGDCGGLWSAVCSLTVLPRSACGSI